jgi:hypothetical protein
MEKCSTNKKKRVDSRRKGNRGEVDFAHWLEENLKIKARRGFGQSAGGAARPDVESSIAVHWEIKCVEKLNIDNAMSQAITDSRFGNIPVVAHKKNRKPWMITLLAKDLEEFCAIITNREQTSPGGS